MSLAYRYLPSTAEERVHVERFFPPVQLAGKSGEPSLAIDCTQLHYGAWPDAVSWSAIKDIKAADQTFRGKVLTSRWHPVGWHREAQHPALEDGRRRRCRPAGGWPLLQPLPERRRLPEPGAAS